MDRRAKHITVLLIWLALFIGSGFFVWNFQAGHLMLAVFLGASALVYIFYAFFARCPHCSMPVLLKPRKIFGIEFYTWSCLTPKKCLHCGKPLA